MTVRAASGDGASMHAPSPLDLVAQLSLQVAASALLCLALPYPPCPALPCLVKACPALPHPALPCLVGDHMILASPMPCGCVQGLADNLSCACHTVGHGHCISWLGRSLSLGLACCMGMHCVHASELHCLPGAFLAETRHAFTRRAPAAGSTVTVLVSASFAAHTPFHAEPANVG